MDRESVHMPHPHGLNPNGPTLFGIDVASPQGPDFDFEAAARDGIEFCWIQVSGPAQRFRERNWPAARAAGLLRGPYRFLSMLVNAKAQADEFLRAIEQLGGYDDGDLHPMVDIESNAGDPSKQKVLDTTMTFVERVEAALRRPVVIYTFPSYWLERTGSPKPHPLGERPLMISHFKVNPETGQIYKLDQPSVPATWDRWDVWQVTGNKAYTVKGVQTDASVFWGTRVEFCEQFTLLPITVEQLPTQPEGAAEPLGWADRAEAIAASRLDPEEPVTEPVTDPNASPQARRSTSSRRLAAIVADDPDSDRDDDGNGGSSA